MLKPDCVEYLKTQCNYYENGSCSKRSCFIRGGWDGKPTNKEITPTCIYKEVVKELERNKDK